MSARYYLLRLKDSERESIVKALRFTGSEVLAGMEGTAEHKLALEALADRIEREPGEEDLQSAATQALRAWYYGRIQGLAEGVLDSILCGDVSELSDYLHETVDGLDLVVYTWKAKCVLLASDNEDAAEEEMGEGNYTPEQRAYFAICADLSEALTELVEYPDAELAARLPEGFDLDDPETWKKAEVEA